MKKLLFGLLLCIVGFGATAEWNYSEKIDEMRGVTQYFATLEPENKNEGMTLEIKAESQNNKEMYDFHFVLQGGELDCKLGKLCSGFIKSDNGEIKELLVEIDRKRQSIASVIGAFNFAKDLSNSQTIYIELPILNEGMVQFKYHPKGLKWTM